jgi:hypothetical protein
MTSGILRGGHVSHAQGQGSEGEPCGGHIRTAGPQLFQPLHGLMLGLDGRDEVPALGRRHRRFLGAQNSAAVGVSRLRRGRPGERAGREGEPDRHGQERSHATLISG